MLTGLGTSVGCVAFAGNVPRDPGDPFGITLSEQVTHDDNVYRLPDDINMADLVPGSDASRDDLVSRTSVAADGKWELARQSIAVSLAVDGNRYAANDTLNNTSGNGRADWNWSLGRDWSGQLGGTYGRSLAGFVNSRFFAKDQLDTYDYHGAASYRLTPHWSLSGRAQLAAGSHDTAARQTDDFESQSDTFGIQYLSRRGDQFGLEYRRTNASFPNEVPGDGLFSDRDYIDRTANLTVSYALTVKTSFQGSIGYLWRHYPRSVIGDFAGPTWNALFHWEPRSRTRIELSQWQEPQAYVDAESNHFEARGTRLTCAWLPTNKISVSFDISRENHDYTGFDPTAFTQPPRRDKLWNRQAALSYTPVQMLELDLTYRVERRDTNRAFYAYDDRSITLGLSLIF